ncbi:MAG: NlpC/P60 family protein, partial [Bacteroidota bacterium]
IMSAMSKLMACWLLSITGNYLSAQGSFTLFSPHTSFPADLDSAKVDSFFTIRGINLHQSSNPELYYEVFRWYKTCYRYGGDTNKGIDCSGFMHMLFEKIYGKKLNSSSASIYTQCQPLKGGVTKAQEGDLLFFKIKKKKISHIGIYLQNGKFAHASTQAGVIISDLDEAYYKRYFYKAGSLKAE